MTGIWKSTIWRQFGAAIDMLENGIVTCPEDLWGDRMRKPEYWYTVYHTLFFLDYYLSRSEHDFAPPPPFTLDELDPSGILPERVYTKDEMITYLEYGRRKCRDAIQAMTEEAARQRCGFGRLDLTVVELLLHGMRHVQHHTAQLYLMQRQTIDAAPGWVGSARIPLENGY